MISNIDRKSKMVKEIGTQNGMSNFSKDENPAKDGQSPRLSVIERVPEVAIGEWFAAWRECLVVRRDGGESEGGSTLTSVPVFKKKLKPEVQSFKKKRRLMGRPVTLVVTSGWQSHFLTGCRGGDTCGRWGQGDGDTSTHQWGWWNGKMIEMLSVRRSVTGEILVEILGRGQRRIPA